VIELSASREGVLLNVHAQPGARREGLAGALGLKPSQIALIAGETSRRKRVLLAGLTVEDAARRIAAALASG
jgi:uncharacterized protein YggU (UPF0235/DUF167 family)